MDYQEYIDLGFKRVEMNDSIEFRQTGYTGFALNKKITEKLSIEATSGDLDKPKMYIKKSNGYSYHVISITPSAVVDLCSVDQQEYKAC